MGTNVFLKKLSTINILHIFFESPNPEQF